MELQSVLHLDEGDRWGEAVKSRRSRRAFSAPPGEEALTRLTDLAGKLSQGGARIMVFAGDTPSPVAEGITKGTNCFAVIGRRKDAPSELSGYIGEAFVLECEALGVGTCWAYSSCNRGAAQKLLGSEYKLDCVTALGIGSDTPRQRALKPLSKLTGLGETELTLLLPWQKLALDYAHIAPSAMNNQPWRFVVSGDGVDAKPSGLMFAKHDCGIAALHLELGAKAGGKAIKPRVL